MMNLNLSVTWPSSKSHLSCLDYENERGARERPFVEPRCGAIWLSPRVGPPRANPELEDEIPVG